MRGSAWSAAGVLLACCLGPGRGQAAPLGVSASSETTKTVTDLYKGSRDPFRMPSAGGGGGAAAAPAEPFKLDDFNIHTLDLKGIMADKGGSIAILVDNRFQLSFILRGGFVYSGKKRVPGVTGTIHRRQKSVTLITTDKDVQTLRLGETEEDLKNPVN